MDDFEWNATTESKLFEAMIGYKPVGINKYFEMACIWEKLQENNIDVASEKIWAHLESMYNLESLDEIEALPFPNDEREFYLPELEFGAMKVKKEEKIEDKNGKSTTTKRNETKDTTKTPNTKEVKKEEKAIVKKDTPRRDSKDGKEAKLTVVLKKEIKKEVVEKPKPMKSRSSVAKEEEKSRTPSRSEEALKRLNKRPTRGSTKPDEPGTPITRKSQSPLTVVTPASVTKRRRL